MIELEGKTVLITGASRGIGRALALRFAREKVGLAITAATNMDSLEEVAAEAREAGSSVVTLRMDVSDGKSVREGFKRAIGELGGLDVLINNAGITKPGLIHTLTEETWDEVVSVNMKGVFLCSKEAIGPMIRRGGGHIISISSLAAVRGLKGEVTYAASKIGLIPMMQTIAKEYGGKNIRANCIMPGFHLTDMTRILSDEIIKRAISHNALGRTTTLDEVAEFAVFLARTENISGQAFNLDSRIRREI